MLTIADGRTSFYQWDIGQGLTVTPGEGETITEVHIGLKGCKKYYVVEPVDGVVAVYDELLQKGDTFLVAYEYVKTADDGHTITQYVFKIIGRPKATDYAYTPTESHSWEWWCNQARSYAEAAESADQAETAADRAEAKADAIKNMTVSAHAEEGTEPTVTKTEEGDTFNLDFGLVRGETGPRGPQGEPGEKGEDGRVTFEDVEPLLITDTASGAIASFPDGSGLDFISLKANIEPQQDLNGYDHPWVGGAGKNKLQNNSATATSNGVTFTKNADGTVTANGTASGTAVFRIYTAYSSLPNADVILNGCPSGGQITVGYSMIIANSSGTNIGSGVDIGNGATYTSAQLANANQVQIIVRNGTTVSNLVFKPMIRLASETDATFAPYSNLCPISGWDSVEVVVSPTTAEDGTTYTATFDETVYGGTVDLVSGVLKIDRAYFQPTSVGAVRYNNGLYWTTTVLNPKAPADNAAKLISSHFYNASSSLAIGNCYVTSAGGLLVYILPDQSLTTAEAVNEWLSENKPEFCYLLAEPRTIQLDPQTITTLVGENNVWSDAGDSEVEYYANAKLYIDKKLGELS